ncbi:MAG: hypothetical protein QXU32_00605 [Nitrososphaerales archaeon]
MILIRSVDELVDSLHKEVDRISGDILYKLSKHVYDEITSDYSGRVQRDHYPLRNPMTREIIESMPPSLIADEIRHSVFDRESAIVYVPPGTEADKSARMQELYGGKPWQIIRSKMTNPDYVRGVMPIVGLNGIKVVTL